MPRVLLRPLPPASSGFKYISPPFQSFLPRKRVDVKDVLDLGVRAKAVNARIW